MNWCIQSSTKGRADPALTPAQAGNELPRTANDDIVLLACPAGKWKDQRKKPPCGGFSL
jgi:hypothetical protein